MLTPLHLIAALLALAGVLIGLQLVLGSQQRKLRAKTCCGSVACCRNSPRARPSKYRPWPAGPRRAGWREHGPTARPPRRIGSDSGTCRGPAVRPAKPTEYVAPPLPETDILDIDILDEDGTSSASTPRSENRNEQRQSPELARQYLPRLRHPWRCRRQPDHRNRVLGRPRHRVREPRQGEPNVSVGRDGRLSGPELVQHRSRALLDSGCDVSDIGMVPTPVLYYAANILAGKSGVMLTGSHNPPDYNGFRSSSPETPANEQIGAAQADRDQRPVQRCRQGRTGRCTGALLRADPATSPWPNR